MRNRQISLSNRSTTRMRLTSTSSTMKCLRRGRSHWHMSTTSHSAQTTISIDPSPLTTKTPLSVIVCYRNPSNLHPLRLISSGTPASGPRPTRIPCPKLLLTPFRPLTQRMDWTSNLTMSRNLGRRTQTWKNSIIFWAKGKWLTTKI